MVHAAAGTQARHARSGTSGGLGTADRFRLAIEAGDHDAIRGLLARDVQVFGPVVPAPVQGIRAAGAALWAALSRFDYIRYVGMLSGRVQEGDGGAGVETHVLRFRAAVGGNPIEGIDIIELDDDGLISTLTVLFRPLDSVIGTSFVARQRRLRR